MPLSSTHVCLILIINITIYITKIQVADIGYEKEISSVLLKKNDLCLSEIKNMSSSIYIQDYIIQNKC